MTEELSTTYEPKSIEKRIYDRWLKTKAFSAAPDDRKNRYVIMMPLPNVTGALHMGHAMDNVMQDLLIRWHRMRGDNTLWMAGTDHAGIATQAVVEKRLFELEGKTRRDVGREGLVERIWQWKEQYQKRIVAQQQAMGCSCDWDRQRFTMDEVCARAVRHTFFNMFRDGLIFRGDRLVNWDCHLQTAVADDEIVHETVDGHFWHIRYPVIDPRAGEPDHVIVATTRPETMLGDTAVAVHPDPENALDKSIAEAREKYAKAGQKEKANLETELERLENHKASQLPRLIQLRDMARAGRAVRLPLQDRPIPLICDEWAKPELGSGCVKITPGHDPNDHDVWKRHPDRIGLINILNEDGTLNNNAGAYKGLDRFAARKKVVADLDAKGLLAEVEDRQIEIGHSDRSKTPIEPFMSKQWFVRMGDLEGGVVCGRGTEKTFTTPGLAQAAMDTVEGPWRSPTQRKLTFHPDERYGRTYLNWLAEKRDWCISRQLWWGHRIPIWAVTVKGAEVPARRQSLKELLVHDELLHARISLADGRSASLLDDKTIAGLDPDEKLEVLVCLRSKEADAKLAARIEACGLVQDPDVLDTWFSSGLWPHSTLGWPDPESAGVEDGQSPLGPQGAHPDALAYYYPGSCLVTGRDIITLWVARMQLMGLYNLGDLPFTDCFIHANILDGKGVRMSKTKGNGIDPVDIIERYGADAMRYVICELQTGSQDIRLPVQAVSPFTGKLIDLAKVKHGSTMFTYICPDTGKAFDVLGTMKDVPAARLLSDRFDVGRNFCNKLWNAARFAFMNLEKTCYQPRDLAALAEEDRWILSRLARAVAAVNEALGKYNPAAAIATAREFFWSELCDWYLEIVKPRMQDEEQAPVAAQVLGVALDQVLRLLHPFVPFITEELWIKLGAIVPQRGLSETLPDCAGMLVNARWPEVCEAWLDPALETKMEFVQAVIRGLRDVRARYNIPPGQPLSAVAKAVGEKAAYLSAHTRLIAGLARLDALSVDENAIRARDAAAIVIGGVELYVNGVIDIEQERIRLHKQREPLAKGVDGARKKLSNENFLQRAKPEVVEREKERLKEMEDQLAGLESNLRDLEG